MERLVVFFFPFLFFPFLFGRLEILVNVFPSGSPLCLHLCTITSIHSTSCSNLALSELRALILLLCHLIVGFPWVPLAPSFPFIQDSACVFGRSCLTSWADAGLTEGWKTLQQITDKQRWGRCERCSELFQMFLLAQCLPGSTPETIDLITLPLLFHTQQQVQILKEQLRHLDKKLQARFDFELTLLTFLSF